MFYPRDDKIGFNDAFLTFHFLNILNNPVAIISNKIVKNF